METGQSIVSGPLEFSAIAELARTVAVDAMVSVLEAKTYNPAKTAGSVIIMLPHCRHCCDVAGGLMTLEVV